MRLTICAAVALIAGLAVPAAAQAQAQVAPDSVGIYSEELERANSLNQVAVGHALRRAGIGLVRQPFSWARIEKAPGKLDYAVYDHVMAVAAIAGLQVLPVLMDPPPWRSTAPASGATGDMYPPRDPAAMAQLAALLVQRYGPGGSFWAAHPELPAAPIRSWQVWNEPNIHPFWATGPDPAAYVRLLRAVGAAIRTVDPAAEIVAAGLPYADVGMTMAEFIDGMYAAGAQGTFDTLAIHPYAVEAAGVVDILRAARRQIDALGDGERPIWATEFGWASGGPAFTITTSEATQAARVRDAIVLMMRARAEVRLRGFAVFRWRDVALNPGQSDNWPFHTGLLSVDGSPKAAYDAFRAAAAGWLRAQAAGASATGSSAVADSGAGVGAPAKGARASELGIRPRTLRIRRRLSGGRLIIHVDVAPGGGNRRVRIAYAALRGKRVALRRTRFVATRRRVASTTFALPRRARAARVLRITARQGDVRAARLLRVPR